MEKWKPITGYEGLYEVSNSGNIKNTKTGKIKTAHIANGYLSIGLTKEKKSKMFRIHTLVAGHFLLNPNKLRYVEFLDGDRKNTKATNLKYQNASRGLKTKLSPEKVEQIRYLKEAGYSAECISGQYNISTNTVYNVCSKKTWKNF